MRPRSVLFSGEGCLRPRSVLFSGEGGIRTHGGPKGHNGFRDRPDQPLRHLSSNGSIISEPTRFTTGSADQLHINFQYIAHCRVFWLRQRSGRQPVNKCLVGHLLAMDKDQVIQFTGC